MPSRDNLYIGKAGQMVVMAEFLERGWNVGAPEVDVGDDIFVVRDDDGDLSRIQVKTARSSEHSYGYSGQFFVGKTQLHALREPPLDYVFVVRRHTGWGPFIVIRQRRLQNLVANHNIGSETERGYRFRIRYQEDDNGVVNQVDCAGFVLAEHLNDFSSWERIEH